MKFYVSKILCVESCGVCRIWLGFEPDPDHGPDAGTRFTPDFCISAGYLKKLWMDFDVILRVDSCRSTKEEKHVFAHVRLSVCQQDYSKTRALIWMKCCMLTDVRTWTN